MWAGGPELLWEFLRPELPSQMGVTLRILWAKHRGEGIKVKMDFFRKRLVRNSLERGRSRTTAQVTTDKLHQRQT